MSERSFGWPSSNKADVLPERGPGDRDRHRVMWKRPRKKRAISKPRRGPWTIPTAQKRTNPADQGFWLPSLQGPVRQQTAVIGACQFMVLYYSSPTNPAEECCTLMCRNIPELLSRCILWLSTSGVGPGIQWGWHASRGSQCYWSSDHTLSQKGLVGTTRNASPLSVWSGMLGNNKAHVPPLLGLCSRACKPQPREAEHLGPGLCNEKPPQWEAHPPRLQSSPCSPQLGKAHAATKTQHSQI